ncbi:MAG: serine hydrolase [Desulfobulbaceae bacterium]|jgi:beta-lactamase class A|nr:serine hydrolase [Desulfobulbaceae bacterium]
MIFRIVLLLWFVSFPCQVFSQASRYDLVFLWDNSMDTLLEYQNQLEEVLDPDIARNLHIVTRQQGDYGLIYDHNGTVLSSAQLMIQLNGMLKEAGLNDCFAVDNKEYDNLFNVSYGLGPDLEALKKQYDTVYRVLGSEVGKNLFIEQTSGDNYTLIYRRRGDRASTHAVAGKHARLLKRKGISTAIIAEKNNPVIFGESSLLDEASPLQEEPSLDKEPSSVAQPALDKEPSPIKEPSLAIIDVPAKKKPAAKSPPSAPQYKKNSASPTIARASSGSAQKELEQTIEAYIKDLRRKGRISSNEKTGWMVYDLNTGESLVDINGEMVFQAASMIKPFVALAFFHRVQQGELPYGPKSRRNMELMIQRSNNEATNWVIRQTGGPSTCDRILRTHYGDIFKNTLITEYIPPGGKTYKNIAPPADYIRFLQALWDDRLPYSREIRRLMSLPGRDRLYDGTPIPQGTLVYNKTGSTAYLCGDMGILVPRDKSGNRYPYALVGIIQRSSRPHNYSEWMLTRGNVIRKVSSLVYKEMKKQYPLL